MLHRDGFAQRGSTPDATGWKPPDGRPHFTPKAKNVIWLFMIGGTSHLESFDPKPALNRYAGKTIAETPFADALKNKLTGNLRVLLQDKPELHIRRTLYPLQVGFHKRGRVRDRNQRLVAASGLVHRQIWPSSARCGRRTTTMGPSFSSTPAGTCSKGSFRRSARGFTMAWAR